MKRRELIRSLAGLAVGVGTISLSALALGRIGRPLSPGSIAGVRRRTRRRMAVGMSMVMLPYGCVGTMIRAGVAYHYCGGIWYRPAYQGTTVVYVVDRIDDGADTNVEFEE